MSLPLGWGGVQPRYAAYCLAHGALSPQEMLERDAVAFPGGKMAGFITWVSGRCAAWKRAHGRSTESRLSEVDYTDFSDWLFTEALRLRANSNAYCFYDGPTETTGAPTIVQGAASGGDPSTVAVLARVHRSDELHRLCALANVALAIGHHA